jgi:hypothetical protein
MKDLEKEYETKLIKKNKGFYIIQAINRWQLDKNTIKL